MNLNHPRWEGHQFNMRRANPVHYNNSAAETSRIRKLHSSLNESNKKQLNEWGSSDQYYFNQSIHRDLGEPDTMPSPFSPEFQSAVESAVDFYWDDWDEYRTDYEGLVDHAKRIYLRTYFPEKFSALVRMFEPGNDDDMDVSDEEDDYKDLSMYNPYYGDDEPGFDDNDLLNEWATLSSDKGELNMEPENHALSDDRHGLVVNHLNEVNRYINQESLHQFVEEVNKVEERLGYVKKNR